LLKKQRERETESNRKTEQYVYLFYVVYLFLYRRKKKKIERERERDGRQRGEGFVFLVSYLLTCYCKLFCFFYSCFGVQQPAGGCLLQTHASCLSRSTGWLFSSYVCEWIHVWNSQGHNVGFKRFGSVRFGSVQTTKSTQILSFCFQNFEPSSMSYFI
jgi:hypothetical protein